MQRPDVVLLSWGGTGDMLLKSRTSVIVPLKNANALMAGAGPTERD